MRKETKRSLSLLICVVMLLALAPQFQLPAAAWYGIPATADIPITRPPVAPETVAQGTCGANITWSLRV